MGRLTRHRPKSVPYSSSRRTNFLSLPQTFKPMVQRAVVVFHPRRHSSPRHATPSPGQTPPAPAKHTLPAAYIMVSRPQMDGRFTNFGVAVAKLLGTAVEPYLLTAAAKDTVSKFFPKPPQETSSRPETPKPAFLPPRQVTTSPPDTVTKAEDTYVQPLHHVQTPGPQPNEEAGKTLM